MHLTKQHVTPRQGTQRRTPALVTLIVTSHLAESTEPVIIAIGGPGGTGKTRFTDLLLREMKNAVALHLDDYKRPRAERYTRHVYGAHPDANYMDLVALHLSTLKEGAAVDKPIYDPDGGNETERFAPAPVILVEGEVATYPRFRDLVDFTIFIDSDWRTQLKARIERDIEVKAYDQKKAIHTYLHSNLEEFSEFGADSKAHADIHLFCDDDYRFHVESVASHLYHQFESILEQNVHALPLTGEAVAVPTPFHEDWSIDEKVFVEYLELLARHDIHRVIVNSSIAESNTLATGEKQELLRLACEYFPGVVLTAVTNNLGDSLALIRTAGHCGADAVYMPPSLDTPWVALFRQVSELPLFGPKQVPRTEVYSSPADTPRGAKNAAVRLLPRFPRRVRPV